MFLKAVASNDERNARAYSASLKDYRSIQVKLIQTMEKMEDLYPQEHIFDLLARVKVHAEEYNLETFLEKLEILKNGEIDSDTYNKMKAVLSRQLEEEKARHAAKEHEQRTQDASNNTL